ncbi:TIGR04255 family protein [Burkholderia multivorans]|uniref:TIGR04255 family protein n=1 Tax=Burkholderia multivorans TaxID=87883 RepID=UPI0009B6D85C|nr:TIGR04255 family protein [Burkholderia multivorans]
MSSNAVPQKGQWANAPLVFVLAQVRFLPSAAAAPEHLRDAITTRIGSRFPTISQTNSLGIEINPNGGPPRATQSVGYDLVNSDVDGMVRVQPGSLTYAVTSYVDSPHFRNQWLEIVDALGDVQVTTVTRLGLRYVDFVIPTRGRRPEDYVNAPWNLAGMPELPGAARGPDLHVSMVDVAFPPGRMRLQFMRGVGVPTLPMDLQGMLTPRHQSVHVNVGECAVIDSDRWIDGEHNAGRATVDQLFTQMHTDVSSAFRAMISPLAHDEWQTDKAKGDAK